MAGFGLRDYQAECRKAIYAHYRRGVRRALVVLPTGTGKTVIFASFPDYFQIKNRMLILAHREELLQQARDKLLRANPNLRVGIEQAEQRADPSSKVVLASVQTLVARGGRRLAALDPSQFKLVVVDEAHHSVAPSYRRVFEHLGLFSPGTEKLLVGFTATPMRGDRRGLGDVFESIVFSRTLREMIEAKYLCPIVGYRVETAEDISQVGTRHGDFVAAELSRAVNSDVRNQLVVQTYRKIVEPRKAIVFCADVAHARALERQFLQGGVTAKSAWGEMPAEERAGVVADLRADRIRVVTNCNLFSEGFDEPSVEAILMARPTQSPLLYTQMVGRGTRLHPGKRNLMVVDFCDNTKRHSLMALPRLFGLSERFDLRGREVTEVVKEWEQTARRFPNLDWSGISSLEEMHVRIRRIQLLTAEIPPQVQDYSRLAWIAMPDESFWLDLRVSGWLTIRPDLLGHYEVSLGLLPGGGEGRKVIAAEKQLERAFRKADRYVQEFHRDLLPLLKQDVKWREKPATDRQMGILQKLGVRPPPGVKRGEAAQLISSARARLRASRP